MINGLSFDLEDWYMVYNFSKIYSFKDWEKCTSRIEENTNKILSVLHSSNTRATFFVLGYVAERFPELIEKIHNQGHEIACHTYKHDLIYNLSKEQFDSDLKKCRKIIKKITKTEIKGFRAPSFSITRRNLWALDILKDNRFVYDSSIFPIKHPDYGIAGFKTYPTKLNNGLIEAPLSTIKLFNSNISIAGGAYFRLMPYKITKSFIKRLNRSFPLFFYLHPWELDAKMPRKKLPLLKSIRHYTNISTTEKKLRHLLNNFRFSAYEDVLMV